MTEKKFYSVKEVADRAGVHRATIRRWLDAGRIPEPDRDRNGWRIFTEEELGIILKYARRTIPSSHLRQNNLNL